MPATPPTPPRSWHGTSRFGELAETAASHHEKLDGSGYHRGLRGDQLSPPARLLVVADMFEAMTAERPYRGALSQTEAFALLSPDVGTRLCPEAFGAVESHVRGATTAASARAA